MNLKQKHELNLRDLGGIQLADGTVPYGRYLRSGKLSILSPRLCQQLCLKYGIGCVIDLRTPLEIEEYPDPLPEGVRYVQMPIFSDATIGITREKGSDPMKMIQRFKQHPEMLLSQIPDFQQLYHTMVTSPESRRQLDQVVALLRQNASQGICTLFHCTAGKDRTGVVSMALLLGLGASKESIVKDYLLTNRNAFFSTIRKCIGIFLLTRSCRLSRAVWKPYMVKRELIEIAIDSYQVSASTSL